MCLQATIGRCRQKLPTQSGWPSSRECMWLESSLLFPLLKKLHITTVCLTTHPVAADYGV